MPEPEDECREVTLPSGGTIRVRTLSFEGVSVDGRPIDYPRAWEIARAVPMDGHHPRCSYRQCDGGMLCDCPVLTAHPEYDVPA